MPADQLFTLYGVKIGTTLLGGIASQNVRPGMRVDTPTASGQARGRVQFIPEGKPTVDFSTYAVGSGLTALTVLGKLIANLSGGLVLYGQLRDDGSASAKTGANHVSYTYASGLLIPTRLSASAQGAGYAQLTANGIITWDGSNEPIVPATNATLPVGLTEDEYYGLGPATIAGISIPQLTSLDVAFGIAAESKGSSEGKQYDTAVWVREVKPVITLKGTAPTTFSTGVIPLNGRIATIANTTVYLRKYNPATGAFFADNTANHIKVQAAGLATIQSVDAGQGEAEITVEMPAKFDGTNECLVVTVGSQIA